MFISILPVCRLRLFQDDSYWWIILWFGSVCIVLVWVWTWNIGLSPSMLGAPYRHIISRYKIFAHSEASWVFVGNASHHLLYESAINRIFLWPQVLCVMRPMKSKCLWLNGVATGKRWHRTVAGWDEFLACWHTAQLFTLVSISATIRFHLYFLFINSTVLFLPWWHANFESW